MSRINDGAYMSPPVDYYNDPDDYSNLPDRYNQARGPTNVPFVPAKPNSEYGYYTVQKPVDNSKIDLNGLYKIVDMIKGGRSEGMQNDQISTNNLFVQILIIVFCMVSIYVQLMTLSTLHTLNTKYDNLILNQKV
jgi:hypothetical protein